jgi:hypothetical protein
MSVDCTGTQERQANLAVWALKKLCAAGGIPAKSLWMLQGEAVLKIQTAGKG